MSVSKIQTGLRIDETTYAKLKAIANNENRTLNNLVEYIIKNYLSDYEAEHGPVPVVLYPDN